MRKLLILFLFIPFLMGAAPVRQNNFLSGTTIRSAEVNEDLDDLFGYLSTGVDNLRSNALDNVNEISTSLCSDTQILKKSGSSWACSSSTVSFINTSTATAGRFFVADGTDFESMAMIGDATLNGAGGLAISDDKILERHLKAVDAASDEECLTYETTTGDFEWQTCSAGGASSLTGLSDVNTATVTDGRFLVADGTDFESVAMIGDATLNGAGGLTISSNAVALATDTTGNYVATVADAGNSNITVTGSGSENAAITLDVVDVTCTDCLNATEIEDIYLLDGTSDTMTGTLTADGLTLGANENITLGAQTLDHDGTNFVFNDSVIADGTADAVQLIAQGHSTQTSDVFVVEQSDGSDLMTVAISGVKITGGLQITDLPNCNLDTDSNGLLTCGVDATGAGSGAFDDTADPAVLNTTTKDVNIGTTHNNTAKLSVDGDADQVQFSVQGFSTQTNNLVVVEQSDGTDVMTVAVAGARLTGGLRLDDLVSCDSVDTDASGNLVCGTDSGGTDSNAVKEYYWDAADLKALEFSGDNIAPIVKEEGTNVDILVRAFDDTTEECASGKFTIPSDVNTGGTVNKRAKWYAATAAANTVTWTFYEIERDTAEVWDTAMTEDIFPASTASAVQDTLTEVTATGVTVSSLGWAASDTVLFEFCRKTTSTSNSLTGDARLVDFTIEIPRQ